MLTTHSFAQAQKDVTGTVTDDAGKPLGGVTVINRKSGTATQTGDNGTYSIRGGAGDLLVFSRVSFTTMQQTVGAASSINVSLLPSTSVMTDVVVVGYGRSSRKALTSAISTIKPEDMNRGAITDAGRLLTGKGAWPQHLCQWRP